MKNALILFTVILFAQNSIAQDLKIKKGIIFLDKKEVAKIDKQDKSYKISSLNEQVWFLAQIINKTSNNNIRSRYWLELTGANGNIREAEYESVPFTFSKEKWVAEAVVKSNTDLLTINGVDAQKVNDFFKTQNRSVSDKWDLTIMEQKAENDREDELENQEKLVIGSNGIISKNGKKIASINKTITKAAYVTYNYTILDSNKKIVATSSINKEDKANLKGLLIKLYDGTVYELNQVKFTFGNIDFTDFENRMVKKINANGYNLQDITKSEKNKTAENANNQINKTNLINIYDAEGYVIDAQNNKITGLITFVLEPESNGKSKNGIVDVSSYGTSVTITTNEKIKTFKAKDEIKFCVNNTCYLGAIGSEDAGLNNSSSEMDVFGGSSKFFKVNYEDNDNYILSYYKSPNDYYLKLKKQKKAVYLGNRAMFGKRKDDKTKKIFDKYVNCTSLNFENYQTNTIEGLKQVIIDYQTFCK